MSNKNITDELCPHCGKEVVLLAEMKAQKCPECGRWIAPCSLCEECKKNCVVEFDCVRLNRNTLTSRELTNEQWQLLADLVLAEMTNLRELSNGRSDEVKNALKVDIGKLHTLYNLLID